MKVNINGRVELPEVIVEELPATFFLVSRKHPRLAIATAAFCGEGQRVPVPIDRELLIKVVHGRHSSKEFSACFLISNTRSLGKQHTP